MVSQLISKYKKILVDLQSTHSGKKKFELIISFFDYCTDTLSGFPPFALAGDFIPILIDVILKNDINFIAPDKLSAGKSILKEAKSNYIRLAGNPIALSQIDKATDILNMQILKSNFYVGNLDEGLNVLKNILEESEKKKDFSDTHIYENLPERQKQINLKRKPGDKYAIVHPDTFREIKAFEILNEIKSEFERLNSYSDTNVNVLLVEQDNTPDSDIPDYSPGTILNLNCELTKSGSKGSAEVKFENITDTEVNVIEEVLKDIRSASIGCIWELRGSVPFKAGTPEEVKKSRSHAGAWERDVFKTEASLKFENVKGIYKGKSFGLAAAVLIACNYFSYANKICRYKISNSAAFTGIVEADGKVTGVNSETIAGKITAAFFSWVKFCIVPKENYNDAVKTCNELKLQYPSKQIEIIPVNYTSDVFEIPEVIRKEKISYKNYTAGIFNRHKVASITFLVVLAALLSFLLANKFLPKDIKDLPVTTNVNNFLIFAPERDTNWIFQNRDVFNGDTIDYGDVATGDFWNPRLIFINNSRKDEEFEINIGGKDKDEFQITWFTNNDQPGAPLLLKPDFPVTAAVKFIPYKSEGKKEAYVEFKSLSSGSTKRIDLKGNAGRLSEGYSIGFLDIDDDLVFEPGTNLLNDNFTLSFWVKPLEMPEDERVFFVSDNNPLTNNKLYAKITRDTLILLDIQPSKTREISLLTIPSKSKIKINEWNFVAISYSDSIIYLVLNDGYIKKNIGVSALRKINDCIVFNNTVAAINKKEYYKINFRRYMDLFCIYNRGIKPEELIRRRFEPNLGKENGLLLCWDFDESNANQVFDITSNDYWPKYHGGINRVLDNPPVIKPGQNLSSSGNGNHVFKRTSDGIARFNGNLFNSKSSFTIQLDFKFDSAGYFKTEKYLVPFFINRGGLDYVLAFTENEFKMSAKDEYRKFNSTVGYNIPNKYDWNRLTLVYDMENNRSYCYINGRKILNSEDLPVIIDIMENYMGISFGLYQYFADPRFFGPDTYTDN
ncbi:MAG: hypothetical protein JW917_08155, partial [Ignavibacteria bacterium]|nr:hypothetical protein [Ignavibacteria bacterium]